MAGSEYQVLLKATIQKITQADLNKATQGLSVNISSKGAENLNKQFKNVEATNKSVFSILKANTGKVMEWAISTGLVYGSLQQIRQAMEYIVDLNKEMTNIQIVTGMSGAEVGKLATDYNKLAFEMGATTLEVAKGSTEWFRQGKSVAEVSELMKSTLMMSKLGNMESAQATEYLTSTLNGFNLEAKDSVGIIDKLVALDNSYATSVAEIAAALQRSSNSAQQAGVTFDELASYITIVSSVTRKSAESIGESFKTIFARMENIKLGQMFEDDATTLNDVEKALSLVNIKIRDSETSFRPMGDVIDEIAGKWNNLNEIEQSAIANAIAGVRQRENFIALMRNYNEVLRAQTIEANNAGLGLERYGIYMQGLEATINKFTTAWQALWQKTITSNDIKVIIEIGTAVLKLITDLGGLVPILRIVAIAMAFIKAQALATVIYGIINSLPALISGLFASVTALNSFSVAEAGAAITTESLTAAMGPLVIALMAVIEAIRTYNREVVQRQEIGKESISKEWSDLISKGTTTKEIIDIVTAALERQNEAYKEGGVLADMFGKHQKITEDALKQTMSALILTTSNFYEYKNAMNEVATAAGYAIDANGKFYLLTDYMGQKLHTLVDELQLVGETQYYTLRATTSAINALKNEDEKIVILIANLKELRKISEEAASSTALLADKAVSLLKTFDDVGEISMRNTEQLKEMFPEEYTRALEIEGNLIKLNVQALKDLIMQKAEKAMFDAKTLVAAIEAGIAEQKSAIDSAKVIVETNNIKIQSMNFLDQAFGRTAIAAINSANAQIASAQATLTALESDLIISQEKADIAEAYYNQMKDGTYWTNALADASNNAASGISSMSSAQSAYNDLLAKTISMLKQEKQHQKDVLQAKLDGFKKIIDARKEILRQEREEEKYQDKLADKNKELSDIDNQLLALQFDNSEEAKAKRLELEAERADKTEEIDEMQADKSLEIQENALDAEYDKYEVYINKKIAAIDKYLAQEGLIAQEAMALIEANTDAFWNSLLIWNQKFGDGLDITISQLRTALVLQGQLGSERLAELPEELPEELLAGIAGGTAGGTGSGRGGTTHAGVDTHHSGGIAGGIPNIKESEIFAKLLKGEVVANDSQMKNFMNQTLPSMITNNSMDQSMENINLEINVAGNLDKVGIMDIKAEVFSALNSALKQKGKKTNAFNYSV